MRPTGLARREREGRRGAQSTLEEGGRSLGIPQNLDHPVHQPVNITSASTKSGAEQHHPTRVEAIGIDAQISFAEAGRAEQAPYPVSHIRPQPSSPRGGSQLSLGVVIPVKEDSRIFRLLDSLSRQAGLEHCQVVVGCDGSPPWMLDRLSVAQKHLPQLDVLQLEHAGPAHAINAAIEKSGAERLLILDSDCAIEPGYLLAMLGAPRDALAARGPIRFLGSNSLARLTARYRTAMYDTVVTEGRLYTPNILIHRELFRRFGAFRTDLRYSYDSEFSDRAMRQGVRATFVSAAPVWHDCHTRVMSEIRVCWHYGRGRHMRSRNEHGCTLSRSLFGDIQWHTAMHSPAQLGYLLAYVSVRTAGYLASVAYLRSTRAGIGPHPANNRGLQ